MKKQQGFTLVELLVVIVIIGILATGSISMFTGAQQKARDAVRITDVQAMKLSLEQSYGDAAGYPEQTAAGLQVLLDNGYIDKLPKDPKTLQPTTNSCLVYIYGAANDLTTGVQAQEFELSAHFENAGNLTSKAVNTVDSGDDDQRWETGVNVDNVETKIDVTDCTASTSTNEYGLADVEAFVVDNI